MVVKVWSLHQRHGHYLGIWWTCKFSCSSPNLLNQNLWGWSSGNWERVSSWILWFSVLTHETHWEGYLNSFLGPTPSDSLGRVGLWIVFLTNSQVMPALLVHFEKQSSKVMQGAHYRIRQAVVVLGSSIVFPWLHSQSLLHYTCHPFMILLS